MYTENDIESFDYQALLDRLFNQGGDIPISPLYQLSDMPAEFLAQFKQRWPTLEDERRRQLARHLADICEENYHVDYSPFTRLFLGDQSPEVRLAGLDLLWDSSDIRFIEPVTTAMRTDNDNRVRASAAATLGHFILMSEWGELPFEFSDTISATLFEQLEDPQVHESVYRAALEAVASAPNPQVASLIQQAYKSSYQPLRISAVVAMGRSADLRWLSNILTELESDDDDLRLEATRAAGFLGSSDALPQLAALAEEDDEYEVRLAAVHALGTIGGDLASRTLSQMAEDLDFEDLHDAIDEALEDMMLTNIDIDLDLIDFDFDEDDEA